MSVSTFYTILLADSAQGLHVIVNEVVSRIGNISGDSMSGACIWGSTKMVHEVTV